MRIGLGIPIHVNRRKVPASPFDALTSVLYAACALRRLVSSWAGPLVTVRRSTDNATMDAYAAGDGWIDTVTLLAWCGTASVFVTRVWDQTGLGRHMEQGASLAQGKIVSAGMLLVGVNGRPVLNFDGASTYYTVSGSMSYTRNQQSITIAAVIQRKSNASSVLFSNVTGSGTRANVIIEASLFRPMLAGRRLNSDPYSSVIGANPTVLNYWHRLVCRFVPVSAMVDVTIDGVTTSGAWLSPGNFNDSDQVYLTTIGKSASGAEFFSGCVSAVILSQSVLGTSQLDAALAKVLP